MQVHFYSPPQSQAIERTAPIGRSEGNRQAPFEDPRSAPEQETRLVRTQHQRIEEQDGYVVLTTFTEERLEQAGQTIETRTDSNSERLEPIVDRSETDPSDLRAGLLATDHDHGQEFRQAKLAAESQRPLDSQRVLSLLADT